MTYSKWFGARRARCHRQRAAALVAAVGLLVVLPATGASADTKPIKIAFVAELSGASAPLGRASLSAAQTAVKIINDSGGVLGHPIQLDIADSQTNAGVAASTLRVALASHPTAMMTSQTSATLTPSVPLVSQSNIPWVTNGALFSGIDKLPFLFSSSPDADGVMNALAGALRSLTGASMKGKRFYAIAPQPSPVNDERLTVLKAIVKKAGGSLIIDREPIALTSFTSQAQTVLNIGPAAVINMHNEAAGTVIGKALAVAGYTGPMVSGVDASSDIFLRTLDRKNLYVVRETTTPAAGQPLFNAIAAAKASTTRYLGQPGNAGKMYAMTFALAKALAKCGIPCPGSKFGPAMRSLGDVVVPNTPLIGALNFKTGQSGLRFGQVWTWDAVANKSVPVGGAIKV